MISVPGRRLPLAIALTAALAVPALADETLDEIVVSATRLETSVRDAARSVSVIDEERIQNGTQRLGLDEALAGVPGLYMQNRYNFAQDLRISLRGFGARSSFGVRGVKVVVDGIPETLPDGQAQVDSIDLGSAGRIEVLRGPASSLYGNASGGVIAVESELGQGEPYVEGSLAAGELGYSRYGLKSAGSTGRVDYLVNVSHHEIEGYREHSDARGTILNSKFALPLGGADDRLTVAFNWSDQPQSDDPGGINAAQAAAAPRSARDRNLQFDAGEALDQQRIGFVYERERDAGTLTLRNYYTWRDFAGKLPFGSGGIVEFDRFVYGVGARYDFGRLPEGLELVVGADVDRQDDDRRRFDNDDGDYGALSLEQQEEVSSQAVYGQLRYALDERWSLAAGLRYDEVTFDVGDRFLADGDDSGEVDFDQLSPSLGVNADLGGAVLFANWSSSFETPTTTELANPDASGGFNEALEPQRADNFELGLKTGGELLYFEVAAFRIDIEDELVPFELAAFPGRTFFANAGQSERRGIETAVNWRHDSGFAVDASWTWSDFTYEQFTDDNGNDFAGNRLPGLPEHFGHLGIEYASPQGIGARFETTWSGELFADNANSAEVDSYTVSNLRLYGDFERGRWRYRPHIGINNIFNESYNSNIRINAFGARYFEPAPTRNVYAGLTVAFAPGR